MQAVFTDYSQGEENYKREGEGFTRGEHNVHTISYLQMINFSIGVFKIQIRSEIHTKIAKLYEKGVAFESLGEKL